MKPKTLLISLQHLMQLPTIADCEARASCKALIWSRDDCTVVLLVDIGNGATVASSADMLIPFVISTALQGRADAIHWSQVRWFQRDLLMNFDEIRIDQYLGGMMAEVAWIPRPTRMRSERGFQMLAAKAGFDIDTADIDLADESAELALCDAEYRASFASCGA